MIKIRAHHGLCTYFFRDFGYDDNFSKNMSSMIEFLNTNPKVKIVSETDLICEKCPENSYGICKSSEKVLSFDSKVLEFTGVNSGTLINWFEFKNLCIQNIIEKDKRKLIYNTCSWNEICKAIEEETFLTR